jgi:hypothetical protein
MMAKVRNTFALFVIVVLLLYLAQPARAQVVLTNDTGKLVGITVGLAAIGAGIGIGTYVAVHHNRRLVGCAVGGPSGLQLRTSGDPQPYALVGEVSAIKQGDRVRVSGKKSKRSGDGPRQFLVEKLEKDYGACDVEHAER